jgi:hypothetical protein
MISNFPALDALITEGILQFTTNMRHPINGEMLAKAVGIYAEPVKYYFFIPSFLFPKFKKQRIESVQSALQSELGRYIRQFAVSVNTDIDSFPAELERKQKRRRLRDND